MKNLSIKWQKFITYLTGYLSIIAFVICGGYFYKNTESEDVKSSCKKVLIITLVFTLIDILRMTIYNILTFVVLVTILYLLFQISIQLLV